ncbi:MULTISPECIES: helix-turn-helix domain-containing protein [unclassified Fusibacter]|uniref:helix-turn-helix domain-containing protein n=1 Tax=unclassified Fusibacter TaxID=2624464 RepID=UPI0013E9185C|nr:MULTISPECIES: helix-turn-helix transcriptional regulator [unclassified Fusibacter]MCK8058353.1 helix-turn-helix domain-containing protein [Fusibacter sp. A2]NPE20936.1 helix-turn-helix transcriptional regulator [Fusibacter sp. A1]
MNYFDYVSFGQAIKKIRVELGIRKSDIKELLNIHPDTLRKIELGITNAKLVTLEQLSELYKIDLSELLLDYRLNQNRLIKKLIHQMDELIRLGKHKHLSTLIDSIGTHADSVKDVIDPQAKVRLDQLQLFIEANLLYESKEIKLLDEAKGKAVFALKLSIPKFNVLTIEHYNYTFMEYRLLMLIGIILSHTKEYDRSALIFDHLTSRLNGEVLDHNEIKLLAKLYFNASYNAYRSEDDARSLNYADLGIGLCLKFNVYDSYPHLLLRKCVAQAYLKDLTFTDTREHCYQFLASTCQTQQLEQFKKVLERLSLKIST